MFWEGLRILSNSNEKRKTRKEKPGTLKTQFSSFVKEEFRGKPKKIIVGVTITLYLLLFVTALILPSPMFFASVIGVYLVLTFLLFVSHTTAYYLNMLSFRKAFYLIYLTLIGFSLVYNFIGISDWQILLGLAGVGIFLDLTLFQTPGISKIWNTEFDKGEHALKNLSESKRLSRNNSTKALVFHKIIAEGNQVFENVSEIRGWNTYKDFLIKYYSLYTEKLNLSVHLIKVEYDDNTNRYSSLHEYFEEMLRYHALQVSSDEQIQSFVQRLELGDEVLLKSDLGATIVLMPFFGNGFGFLLSVIGKGEVEANQIDAMYLLNMAYIMDWHID